jgi:hypothetical protein
MPRNEPKQDFYLRYADERAMTSAREWSFDSYFDFFQCHDHARMADLSEDFDR